MATEPDKSSAATEQAEHDAKSEDHVKKEITTDKTESKEADNNEPPVNGYSSNERKASENKEEAKTNPDANGHKPPDQKAHHTSSDLKDMIAERKNKIKTKTKPAGGFDETPLPDVPPGFTVKFIIHKATNLPAADISSASSDPFIHVTLKTALPKRHHEDPDLTHRTRTIRKTTTPEWNDEWIVANVPASGFTFKCRIYDEDYPDHNDRLGNVTVKIHQIDENWEGFPPPGREFKAKKRVGSKRAYFVKAISTTLNHNVDMSPRLWISIQVLGRSDPPGAQLYTVGPTTWFKHFSPMIGRITGTKVNKNDENDSRPKSNEQEKDVQKYDFQSNEIQLSGPIPPELYHRYVEFRPVIGLMFSSSGIRGRILNKALRKQHSRVYNFDSSTEYGSFEPCSEEASMQLLKMAHFDEGGRIFTYVLTLDGMFRFTETGKEFSIDLLSKHTMHSDVQVYIACSGEFFIRRLEKPDASEDPEPNEKTHPSEPIKGGPPGSDPPNDPSYYQLIIDNDSGTYRPDKSILPKLKEFMEHNFPGLGVIAMHCADEELEKLKKEQAQAKKKEGKTVNMVLNRSPSSSSMSSNESALEQVETSGKSRKQKALDVVEEPQRIKEMVTAGFHGAESSKDTGM